MQQPFYKHSATIKSTAIIKGEHQHRKNQMAKRNLRTGTAYTLIRGIKKDL